MENQSHLTTHCSL